MDEKKEAIIEHFRYILPLLNAMSVRDVGVGLTDREHYLLYKPGKKLDMKAHPGMALKPGSAVMQAMTEKRRVVMRGDKSIFGMLYIAAASPIFDEDGEVIGCAVTSEAVELQDTVLKMAATLNGTVSVLASTIEELSAQTQEIAGVCVNLAHNTLESQQRVNATNKIIDVIRNIGGNINLLGLNAAIEAARVGDAGRGFGVVADEIRKLSASSADSVKMIDSVLTTIQADSNRNYAQLTQVNEAIAQIASAISQIAGTVQQSSSMVHELKQLAESMSKDDD
jgi:hypothetical protein